MPAAAPDLARHDTLPKLLRHNAATAPDEVALREKDLGIWHEITWRQYLECVHHLALGLQDLGVRRGEVVGLIGDNRPDWVGGEIAAHALSAMSLGIYRDALDDEIAYLIEYAQVHAVLADDEEQVDKLLNLGDRIPSVRHIVYLDPRGMRKYDYPRLLPVPALVDRGRTLDADRPDLFDALVDATAGEDVAVLCTTSGTTSRHKLAMLQGGALLRHSASYLSVDPKGPDDEYVSVLPLPWIMEQIYVMGQALISRMKVNFAEEPETLMHDFREIGPTFVLFAPRLWERIAADVRARMLDA